MSPFLLLLSFLMRMAPRPAARRGPFSVKFEGNLNDLISHMKSLYTTHFGQGNSQDALQAVIDRLTARLNNRATGAGAAAAAVGAQNLADAATDPNHPLHGIASITPEMRAAHPYWPPGWLMHPDRHTGVLYPGYRADAGMPAIPEHMIGARRTGRGPFA